MKRLRICRVEYKNLSGYISEIYRIELDKSIGLAYDKDEVNRTDRKRLNY